MLALPAQAQRSENSTALQRILECTENLRTMQCDFVQTKHLKILDDDFVSYGRMCYARPGKLRWEYTAPYTYTFILNGSQVKLVSGGRTDVIDTNQSKVFKEITRIMMNSVVGKYIDNDRDFKTTLSETSTEWVATMLPQSKTLRQLFTRMVLHFDKQRVLVSCVELTEKNGDRTVIELKNIKTNQPIDAKLFAVD